MDQEAHSPQALGTGHTGRLQGSSWVASPGQSISLELGHSRERCLQPGSPPGTRQLWEQEDQDIQGVQPGISVPHPVKQACSSCLSPSHGAPPNATGGLEGDLNLALTPEPQERSQGVQGDQEDQPQDWAQPPGLHRSIPFSHVHWLQLSSRKGNLGCLRSWPTRQGHSERGKQRESWRRSPGGQRHPSIQCPLQFLLPSGSRQEGGHGGTSPFWHSSALTCTRPGSQSVSPGQSCKLQGTLSWDGPGQGSPPFLGGGSTQLLWRLWWPPPQETLQGSQGPHSAHAPATGQACTKQDWLRSWSIRQLPPGRGGLRSSRRWKMRPRPQLRLQSLQPDQGANTQSTQLSSSEPSWQFSCRSQRCSRGRHSPLPQLS